MCDLRLGGLDMCPFVRRHRSNSLGVGQHSRSVFATNVFGTIQLLCNGLQPFEISDASLVVLLRLRDLAQHPERAGEFGVRIAEDGFFELKDAFRQFGRCVKIARFGKCHRFFPKLIALCDLRLGRVVWFLRVDFCQRGFEAGDQQQDGEDST